MDAIAWIIAAVVVSLGAVGLWVISLVVRAVVGDAREERRLRELRAAEDRAWDREMEERRLALDEEIMRSVAGAPAKAPHRQRITWAPEMDEEIRNA